MKVFLTGIISVVVIVIGIGLFLSGSPAVERVRRFDDLRVQHLISLQSDIITFWQAKVSLPDKLNELNDPIRGVVLPTDPQTGTVYEYEKKGDRQFTLCAIFGAENHRQNSFGSEFMPSPKMNYPAGPFMKGQTWEHSAGRVCFERTIDPDFFATSGGAPPKGGGKPPKPLAPVR